ncbi:ADP-ribose pyrophosphatase, mitochondrial [Lethenteron reissneri]|uniref:ADP-ribose pyrophosphatase, mitochondrial n=1 Tax=Lethenteron reissneri TaxID=7753 RepID=UPI002AB7B072|nr:ADP-ribose pyrophosphatase, mitochondrial [Lethenteron reissneri]
MRKRLLVVVAARPLLQLHALSALSACRVDASVGSFLSGQWCSSSTARGAMAAGPPPPPRSCSAAGRDALAAGGCAPLNVKCRGGLYSGSTVKRFPVPDDHVAWGAAFPEYAPKEYTAPAVLAGPVWADPQHTEDWGGRPPKFNELDGKIDRRSHMGRYEVIDGLSRNPIGRTGIKGRGLLGRWGPNHAADPIVTRWKRVGGVVEKKDGKPILQFVAIKRKDNNEWAIPGGMVDAGEKVSLTLRREFGEEALNSMQLGGADRKHLQEQINKLFSAGEMVYKGYVDDPRNTDNAWMETVAVTFHDDNGENVGRLPFQAGDDAVGVKWVDAHSAIKLYASHTLFLQKTAKLRHAYW